MVASTSGCQEARPEELTEAGQGFLEAGIEPETQRHAKLGGATPSQKASLEVKWPCGNSSSLSPFLRRLSISQSTFLSFLRLGPQK